MLEALTYTIVAIALYLASDWLLRRIEAAHGRPFQYRTLIFFVILLLLALASFALIRRFLS